MNTEVYALATALGQKLQSCRKSVTAAESCTGGKICAAITDVAGSSEWFQQGFVTYSNNAKREMLGVPEHLLTNYGAVSEEVVRAMLKGALVRANSEFGVAVSGIAGPAGGSKGKPVGTVWIASGAAEDISATCFHFDGDRASVRQQALIKSLELLVICCG